MPQGNWTITIGEKTVNADNAKEYDIPVTYNNPDSGYSCTDTYTMAPSYSNLVNQIEVNLAAHQDADAYLTLASGAFTLPT